MWPWWGERSNTPVAICLSASPAVVELGASPAEPGAGFAGRGVHGWAPTSCRMVGAANRAATRPFPMPNAQSPMPSYAACASPCAWFPVPNRTKIGAVGWVVVSPLRALTWYSTLPVPLGIDASV